MRVPRRFLRYLFGLDTIFFVIFCICLFIFWASGFRERTPDELQTLAESAQTTWVPGLARYGHQRTKTRSELRTKDGHPIPQLMEDAEREFNAKLARQSKTFEDAVKEYRRRYKRMPPRGFDVWWDFARQYDFKMVDEFDILMEDLAPFAELPGKEIRRRVDQVRRDTTFKRDPLLTRFLSSLLQVGQLPSIDIVKIRSGFASVHNIKTFKDSETSARARGFRSMMGKFVHMVRPSPVPLAFLLTIPRQLPDMDFPINAKAEGRVLIPWEHQLYPNLTKQDSSGP